MPGRRGRGPPRRPPRRGRGRGRTKDKMSTNKALDKLQPRAQKVPTKSKPKLGARTADEVLMDRGPTMQPGPPPPGASLGLTPKGSGSKKGLTPKPRELTREVDPASKLGVAVKDVQKKKFDDLDDGAERAIKKAEWLQLVKKEKTTED